MHALGVLISALGMLCPPVAAMPSAFRLFSGGDDAAGLPRDFLAAPDCMLQQVPPWRYSYAQLQEKFRPCVARFLERSAFPREMDKYVHGIKQDSGMDILGHHGVQDLTDNFLIGHNTDLQTALIGFTYHQAWIYPQGLSGLMQGPCIDGNHRPQFSLKEYLAYNGPIFHVSLQTETECCRYFFLD